MSNKKTNFNEESNRTPSLTGRGTTTVKRDAFSEGVNRNGKISTKIEIKKSGK